MAQGTERPLAGIGIAGDSPGFFRVLATPDGDWLGFGARPYPSGILPPAALDSAWIPTGMVVPVLHGPDRGPIGKWRTHPLSQYADTIRGRLKPGPIGPTPEFSSPPGLEFLLFTWDGGAIAGGKLRRRNGKDTLAVIAIKIPREDIVGVRLREADRRPGRPPEPPPHLPPPRRARPRLGSEARQLQSPAYTLWNPPAIIRPS